MKTGILIFTLLLSAQLFAMDEYEYDELLEKHMESGHLTEADIDEQKFEHINSMKYQNEFDKQVRGVASKITTPKKTLHLINPELEISVK